VSFFHLFLACRLHQIWRSKYVRNDHGISGAKGRNGRPAFDALCRDATNRQFDVVMAWNVDRLGRSLKDLVAFLAELHALGIDLFPHQQGLDTTTPSGKAMFQMLGVFAEFERSIIQERVRAGLQRAKREGKRLGRPPIADTLAERIRTALAGGMSVRKTAPKFDVNPSTVQRIARPFDDAEHAASPPGRRHIGLWARQAGGLGPAAPLHCKHLEFWRSKDSAENRFWSLI
jgi:DNA invertase Pin-like site-specific DNA recombinase